MTDEDLKAFQGFCRIRGYRFGAGYNATHESLMDVWRNALAHARRWLPIETAPKDGTEIILRRGKRVTAGAWGDEQEELLSEHHATTGEYLGQFPSGNVFPAYWSSWDGGFTEDEPPTQWMPLPSTEGLE